jgi:hypothetical protein
MKRNGRPLVAWLVAALLAPAAGHAGPPDSPLLPEVLARLYQTEAVSFRYEETRTLELLAAPWRGWGYLFSSPDGTLVKLQLSPERVVMAITGERMLYHDAAHGQRQSAPLAFAGAMAGPVALFRSVLQGRGGELQAHYEVTAERRERQWRLRFAPKAPGPDAAGTRIEMSGADAGPERRIVIEQADGERTEYRLEKTEEGRHLEVSIQRLLLEAQGD